MEPLRGMPYLLLGGHPRRCRFIYCSLNHTPTSEPGDADCDPLVQCENVQPVYKVLVFLYLLQFKLAIGHLDKRYQKSFYLISMR